MSESLHRWYSLPDLEGLAERGAVLDGEIRIGALERLCGMLGGDGGSVRATVSVRRKGHASLTLDLEYRAELNLVCQRCLEPLPHLAQAKLELSILEESSSESINMAAGCEPLILDGGRLQPAQVIEDELIVSLPLVPRHHDNADCGELVGNYMDSSEAQPGPSGGAL